MPSVYSFKNKDEISQALAKYVKKVSKDAIARHGKFIVGLSGGSLPAILSKDLVKFANEIEFAKWEVFFADERAVPLDSEDSNYKLCKDELFSKVPIPEENIYKIEPSLLGDPSELADAYNQVLVGKFAARTSVRYPVFDVLFLGMGPDGHTCSLFPGHALLNETESWVAAITDSPKPPLNRITLTLPVIFQAHKIAFVAAGEEKKDILKDILEDPEKGLPCSLVNKGGGDKVEWFVDDGASKLLSQPKTPFKL